MLASENNEYTIAPVNIPGLATEHEKIGSPFGVCLDHEGNLIISDWAKNNIRKLDIAKNFELSTLPVKVFGPLKGPCGVCVDKAGNIYVAEYSSNRITMISTDRRI